MKGICIIGPSMKMGGMERASVNLANSISDLGVNVVFISFFKQSHFFNLNKKILLIEPSGFNENRMSIFRSLLWLRSEIKSLEIQHIIVFNKLYAAITCLSLIYTDKKIFLSERSSPLYKFAKPQNIFIDIIFSIVKPYGVIAQTSIAKKYQQLYYGRNVDIKVVPNALRKVSVFPNIVRKNIIVCVGRLNDPLKGFDRLLNAFAMVEKKDWILQIVGGDKNEDPILTKIIDEKGIENCVQFLGKVKFIDRVLAEASIFVIPSRSEGFPNALCEAMAAGLPCISFDFIAGPRDIIEHNYNGFIVEDNNVPMLAFAIERLINNKTERKRLGTNASLILDKYSGEIISNKIMNFIKNKK